MEENIIVAKLPNLNNDAGRKLIKQMVQVADLSLTKDSLPDLEHTPAQACHPPTLAHTLRLRRHTGVVSSAP